MDREGWNDGGALVGLERMRHGDSKIGRRERERGGWGERDRSESG
jgi:hypothetical protein